VRGCATARNPATLFEYRVCLARNAAPGGKRIRLEKFFCCSAFQPEIF
jgi:hypothetical protein